MPYPLKIMTYTITPEVFASILDHTLLAPIATKKDHKKLCDEAAEICAGGVCVYPARILEVADYLSSKNALYERKNEKIKRERGEFIGVRMCAVVGFALGMDLMYDKAELAQKALNNGAHEIDMVANNSLLKERTQAEAEGNESDKTNAHNAYRNDILTVARVVKTNQERTRTEKYTDEEKHEEFEGCARTGLLKVIIETCYLTKEEKQYAARTVAEIGRELEMLIFVKTSTGFGIPKEGPKGATVEDIALIREAVGPYSEANRIGIKASGGISDIETALKMIHAGGILGPDGTPYSQLRDVIRIGTSSGKKLYDDFRQMSEERKAELLQL